MAIADWDAMLAVNLRGPFVCARAVIPGMVDRRYGKIVNVASIAAYGAVTPGQSHYAAAKAGVIGLTKTLAYELGPHNVNVNAVAPGVVHSEMLERAARSVGMDYDEFCGQRAAGVALRRLGKPEDVANAIAFLASDEAAYIHGEVIHVTGGPVRGA
jgi:3-oxoacyl-[acyl-carrier protein] reductase